MALAKTDFNEVGGLWTSANDLQRPANTLRDCVNVVFTEAGRVRSRKGHPVVWAPASSETALKANSWLGLFESPASVEEKYIFYVSSSTYALVARVDPKAGVLTTNNAIRKYVTISGSAPVEATPTADIYTPGAVTASGYWTIPRSVVSQENVYFMSSSGLFRNVQGSGNTKFKKVVPASFTVFNPTSVAPASGRYFEAWFMPGYKVAFRAILKEQISEEGYIEWGDSGVVELVNYDTPRFVEVDIDGYIANQAALDTLVVEVYRTRQYLPNEAPPTQMFLAASWGLDNSTVSNGNKFAFTNELLTLGDDAVEASNRTLYFDTAAELKNVTPPVSKEMVSFKGYTLYGNVTRPPIASLTLTDVPPSGAVLAVSDDGTDLPATFVDTLNEGTAPTASIWYLTTFSAGVRLGTDSYKGVSTTDRQFAIVPVLSGGSTKYGVPPQVSTSNKIEAATAGTVNIMKVTLNSSFRDISPFVAPGILALVASNGTVRDLVSYTDLEIIPTSNRVEFQGAVSLSGFADAAYGTGAAGTTYYIYFLPGTSFEGLPVYPRGADYTTAPNYYSLLPTLINFSFGEYIQYPIGRLVAPKYVPGILGLGYTAAGMEFLGIRSRDAASRALLAAQEWVKSYNTIRSSTGTALSPEAWWAIVDNKIKIYFMNLKVGDHPAYSGPQSFLKLRKAAADIPGSPTYYDTDPNIEASDTEYTDILFDEAQIKNGLTISKLNRPEAVSLAQMTVPTRIGRDDLAIERLAVTEDAVYVFKEKEGIYRVDLAEGSENPRIASVILLDNTTWLVGSESVQEVGEAIYFLSNKGVARIVGTSVEVLSSAIDTEVRSALTKSIAAGTTGSIRSFGNEARKLYGVYIPGSTTYVLDLTTGMWGKWDLTPTNAMVSTDGRLLTSNTLSWNYLRQDVYTSALDDDADQYDLEVPLSSATTSTTGNVVSIDRDDSTFLFGQIGTVADFVTSAYILVGSTYYPVTLAKTSADVLAVTFESTPPTITPATDKIVLGVAASVTSNKFWPLGPASSAQFSKFYGYVTGVSNNISVGFETDNVNPDFSGSTFSTFPTESDILTTLVPRCQGNGRWTMFRLTHSYPKQFLQFDGFSWLYRPIRNNRVERD